MRPEKTWLVSRPDVAQGVPADRMSLRNTLTKFERQQLATLLMSNETVLTERMVAYGSTRTYSHLVSTLPEAWRASIQGLTGSIILMLDHHVRTAEIDYDAGIGDDPSTVYGIEAGRRHRLRGVTLETFIGAFKGYRDVYLRLVEETQSPGPTRDTYIRLVRGFFDRAEIGICAHWSHELTLLEHDDLLAENRRLVNEKNKYLTIFESLHEPVFLVDEAGAVENMNHAGSKLFAQHAMPGLGYYGPEPTLSFAVLMGFDAVLLNQSEGADEATTCIGDRWFAIKSQEMLDVSKKFLGTVVTFHDITETRRAREQAEALAKAKTDFLATMSHEIRTPIHSICGIAELLRQGELTSRDRGYVEAIERSTEVLTSIVTEVLDYTRIESGSVSLENVEFSVESILDDVARMMQPLARRKPELRMVVETATLPTMMGDPHKLKQILINFASNAVKFTDAGTVVISAEPIRPGSTTFRFSVSDTGPGIAPEKLDEIFKPFMQSDNTISRRHGGTGLGLAICKRLAELMGGRIDVHSTVGIGSRFSLELDLDEPRFHDAESPALVLAVSPPACALHVLVVEDDEVNALVASRMLIAAGHSVHVARTGEEALVAVAEQCFDVVLTDLNLPDIDGFELARSIRRLADVQKARVPLVALSAHGPAVDTAALSKAGLNAFIGKPFRFSLLEEILWRVVGASSPTPIGSSSGSETGRDKVDPVDHGVLRSHAEALGVEPAVHIVGTFKRCVLDTARALENAFEIRDWREVASIAHRLRSSARHVGFNALAERAAKVEAAAEQKTCPTPLIFSLVVQCRTAAEMVDVIWAGVSPFLNSRKCA